MFYAKKYLYLIVLLCFLTISFSFHLWAEEGTKKIISDQQKAESKQKPVPTFKIKGAKIEIAPDKRTSEKQKNESKKEHLSTENQPQIFLHSTHYDFGGICEGDDMIHTFTIKNTGTAQLNIKYVKRD
jgi:hypothetical protein